MVYGFRLASEVAEQKAISAIKESEEDLVKEMKAKSGSEDSQELKVSCASSHTFWRLNNIDVLSRR